MFNYSDLDFKLAERFTALALGADQYYNSLPAEDKESSLREEGLIPVDFSGIKAQPIGSFEEAIDGLIEVYQAYAKEQNPIRRNYMWQQIASFIRLCHWQNKKPFTYRELVRELMYIDENPVSQAALQNLGRALAANLAKAGYQGNLKQQIAAWHQKRVVKGEAAIAEVLQNLLAESQEKTIDMGLKIAADYQVQAKVVKDVPYNAYCDFAKQSIYINGNVEYTVDQLKHLVCHEAFPGHMVHLAQRRALLQKGQIPADAGLVITNTASSPVFEGLADNGMSFLNWQNDLDDQICHQLSSLQAMVGLNAAHLLHAEHKPMEQVKQYLLDQGLGSEAWAEARVRFINYPLRKPFIYSYWRGYQAVEQAWRPLKQDSSLQNNFFNYLYNHMHSADTILQFKDLIN